MTPRQKELFLQLIETRLINWNFTKDNYGHFHKKIGGWHIRLKIQDNSIRIEYQMVYTEKMKEWRRIESDFIKNIQIFEDKYILIKNIKIDKETLYKINANNEAMALKVIDIKAINKAQEEMILEQKRYEEEQHNKLKLE